MVWEEWKEKFYLFIRSTEKHLGIIWDFQGWESLIRNYVKVMVRPFTWFNGFVIQMIQRGQFPCWVMGFHVGFVSWWHVLITWWYWWSCCCWLFPASWWFGDFLRHLCENAHFWRYVRLTTRSSPCWSCTYWAVWQMRSNLNVYSI